jgi:hypothetical protein
VIRSYVENDFDSVKRIHSRSGLPEVCLPYLGNPNFIVKRVAEVSGKVVQAGFLKRQAEAFVLVDHNYSTPSERWEILQELAAHVVNGAAKENIECISAWIPPQVEASFGKKLLSLGFLKSPWPCYSLIL